MRVMDLRPGTEIQIAHLTAVHVATVTPHPIYGSLSLVVWVLSDGSYSLDALSLDQEVGEPTNRPHDEALRWAIFPSQRKRTSADAQTSAMPGFPMNPADVVAEERRAENESMGRDYTAWRERTDVTP